MIVVIGARSKIGSELIQLLSQHGHDVRALLRAAEGPMAEGVVSVMGDYRRSGPSGYASRVTDTVERVTGEPPRSLDRLLSETLKGSTR
jgi:nucleoside-diphosphate-sugar epimerase